jgi:hypothetical protein
MTFAGLLYDFQATGDFLLAETGPDFSVQTRQVSGAPTWPNAAVNKAVALQAGNAHVAICASPTRVQVEGALTQLPENKAVQLSDGVEIIRTGNTFIVRGPSGDSLRAVVSDAHIDVSVGLGRWPSNVRGLLANAARTGSSVQSRDGHILTAPFTYDALYGHYTESWRVPPNQSLLMACGREVDRAKPRALFFAKNLDPLVARRARAVCVRAGVAAGPLQDACTLDVAVIGNERAAKVFATLNKPTAVGDAR